MLDSFCFLGKLGRLDSGSDERWVARRKMGETEGPADKYSLKFFSLSGSRSDR
ncbi:hypothetical protein [Porphyromonas endodontalis]|uniref:hypothetical protein n=1 Tax=Porphyromonas endodontalis TaxID=28124 RepID=UPI003FA025FF